MCRFTIVFLLLTASFFTYANDGKIGFSADVSVDGFFSPTLKNFTINKVDDNSPAEKAGITVGDKILAIDGCEIPGCPSDKAKGLMKRKTGEVLPLLIKKNNGQVKLISVHVG